MSKRKIIIIIILVVLNVYFWSMLGYSKLSYNTYKPKPYEHRYIYVRPIEQTLTKESAKKLIKKLYNTPHIYKEKSFNGFGRSIILYRKVEINKDLELNDYIITYAHELTHIKYCTENETWVSYKTFKTLYESGNEELKYHAMVYASEVLKGYWQGTDYDCGYYLLNYFGGTLNENNKI